MLRIALCGLATMCFLAAPATAQSPAAPPAPAASAGPAPSGAPEASNAAARPGAPITAPAHGVRRVADAPSPKLTPPPPFPRGVALMILGGAALLTGAVIGGDAGTIIMIGGGVVGLYGLWLYIS